MADFTRKELNMMKTLSGLMSKYHHARAEHFKRDSHDPDETCVEFHYPDPFDGFYVWLMRRNNDASVEKLWSR